MFILLRIYFSLKWRTWVVNNFVMCVALVVVALPPWGREVAQRHPEGWKIADSLPIEDFTCNITFTPIASTK
jgi:hypothetical protein